MSENSASQLTAEQARLALDGIAHAQARSSALYRYRQAAPFFFVWAVVWLLGYGATDLLPDWSGPAWLLSDALGVGASIYLAKRQFKSVDGRAGWRIAGVALTMCAFIFGALVVFAPVSGRQVSAFMPLVVAAAYTGVGLWLGARFVVAGLLLTLFTLLGHVYITQHFNLWMAVVGSATLALAGVWLRRV